MIGNDVVDFSKAALESNWKRKGWLDKLFTKGEQYQIKHRNQPDRVVWLLWSMKEAGYKAQQRQYQLAPKFNPKSFECQLLEQYSYNKKWLQGMVHSPAHSYLTSSEITTHYVHTIAGTKNGVLPCSTVLKTSNTTALGHEIILKLPNNTKEKYCLKKDGLGIPNIYLENGQLTTHLVSLSHHGRFGGYALIL